MSTTQERTQSGSFNPGMGHNEPNALYRWEEIADRIAVLAWRDAADAAKKGKDGTSTQRLSAAMCYHAKFDTELPALRKGLERDPKTGDKGNAWETLLGAMKKKFGYDEPTYAKPRAHTAEEEAAHDAWKARNAMITFALRLACIMDSFDYYVDNYFDEKAGLWNIFPIKLCPNNYAPRDLKARVLLNGKPVIVFGPKLDDWDRVNMTLSDLVRRYDPPKPSAASAKKKAASAKAKGTGKPQTTTTGKPVYDNIDDLIPALHRKLCGKGGAVIYIPRKFGTGDNQITVELFNMMQELGNVAKVWARELATQRKGAPQQKRSGSATDRPISVPARVN